jgi:hypothetical protein
VEEDIMMTGLMSEYAETCTLMEKVRVPDGEGGWVPTWTEGVEFQAAITHDNTIQARVAESEGMMATYTVTTDKNMPLDFHDVFRRNRDGQVFRVTSDGTDRQTPARATFQVSQVSAEEWSLT